MAYIGKSPSGLGVRTRYYYTATGGETSLSGADDNGRVLKFTDGEYIDVYLNGVLLVAGTDYGTGTANTISSLDALSAGNIVEIVAYDIHSLAKPNLEALRKRYYKTATGGETSISGNDDDGQAITFAANAEIEVYLNGVALVQGDDYNTTTANTVGGLAALDADDIVSIVAYEEFTLGDVVSKKSGGTFASDVTFSQDISVGVNATITGDLTVDTDTLVVDSTNNRVGVGTASPTADLHLSGSGARKIDVTDTGGASTRFSVSGSNAFLGTTTSNPQLFITNDIERMRIDSSGNVGIGTSSPDTFVQTEYTSNHNVLTITTGGGNIAGVALGDTDDTDIGGMYYLNSADALYFYSNASERMRIDSSGNVLVGTTNNAVATQNSDEGANISNNGRIYVTAPSHHDFNRTGDGEIIRFRSAVTPEGSISISGDTVHYNGFTGSHWTRLSDNSKPTILRGTVLESIGTMMDWYQAEFDITTQDSDGNDVVTTHKVSCAKPANKNVGDTFDFVLAADNEENLPAGTYSATLLQEADVKHVKSKVSDTSESKAVYGVFSHWDDDDVVNDMYVASVGTYVIRILSTETVAIGDLLDSNGDGTAKVQSDDIIRSRTIGKVLSTVKQETYSDGSYTVPCALYCG